MHIMKRIIITLFILAALGGLVFLGGWAQLTVPPGAYGVVRSKTHGVDPRPVQTGEFRWIWYKLIPTNVAITVFRPERTERAINAANTLPSGGIYAAFAGIPGDFSWEIQATLAFTINPAALVSLASDKSIDSQEALLQYQNELAGRIESFILGRIAAGDDGDQLVEDLLQAGESAALEQELARHFPEAANISCQVRKAEVPDFALYRQVRGLYEDFVTRQRELNNAALEQETGRRMSSRFRFDDLERYGELLTKYPILLDYLQLENSRRE